MHFREPNSFHFVSGVPRRLCMIVHGDFPLDPRVAREARTAQQAGFEVDVVAMRREGEAQRESFEGIRVHRLPFTHARGVGVSGMLKEYLGFTAVAAARVCRLMFRRRYAIVHVHNPPDFLIAAAMVPKLLGSRVIFDIHDLAPDMFDMRFRGRRGSAIAERVLRILERAACRLADVVITVHEPYRNELVSRGVREEKVIVVMNSLDETLLPAVDGDAKAIDPFRIVYHGTITPHYGVDLLVEAVGSVLTQIEGAELEIYGEGDDVPNVRRRAAELGIADRVVLTGEALVQREVLARINGASVGVIPNRPTRLNRFALSSKLFEYVALGIPVVCADLATIREYFSESEVLFFRAGDAASLAEALHEVARSPEAATMRAESARLRYEAYRWPSNAERYLALLDQLAPRRA